MPWRRATPNAVEAQDAATRRLRPGEEPLQRRVSSARGQSACSSRGGPGSTTATVAGTLEHERGSGAREADDERPLGHRRLLDHPGLEIGIRAPDPACDAPRGRPDLRREGVVDAELDPGRPREQLDRPVVVGRPEPAGDAQEVVPEPLGQRGLEIGRIVADDRDRDRRDPERDQRRREERAVAVVPVAADELGARGDDRGARPRYAGRQPVGVTMITRGWSPGTCTSTPRDADLQVLGSRDRDPQPPAADRARRVALLHRAVELDRPFALSRAPSAASSHAAP